MKKGVREIARELGLSRNTVRCYLREEQAVRYAPPTGRSPTRHSTMVRRASDWQKDELRIEEVQLGRRAGH